METPLILNQADNSEPNPLRGWNILSPDYEKPNLLDGLSFEWDYHMLHDDKRQFTGIVGYFLSDPRNRLQGAFLPSGGSIAVAGEFHLSERVADFESFRLENTTVSANIRSFQAFDPLTDFYATLTPVCKTQDESDQLILQGRSASFEWDLVVTQDWSDRDSLSIDTDAPFSPVSASDVGILPGEHWSVDMIWPRTHVEGQMTYRPTGQCVTIEGHGYRENSWGRWSLAFDGWDFGVVSDAQSGVQLALQTYHRSKHLKYLDISFLENSQLKGERFRTARNELGWFHTSWRFNPDVQQCIPLDTTLVGENERYRVEAHIAISERQTPILSDTTSVTSLFFIMEHFPYIQGKIINRRTGEVVTQFSGQAGSEFAYFRSLLPRSLSCSCTTWKRYFSSPLP